MRHEIVLLLSAFVYLGLLAALVAYLRWRRKSRWPFKLEHKLLRTPGESLRRQITEWDEKFLFELFYVLGGVAAALAGMSWVSASLAVSVPVFRFVVGLAIALGLGVSLWRVARLWQRRQRLFLGWFGERVVGERLEETKLQGWRIFHDVPFASNGRKFNIDHVAVGLGGIYAFETKARRKGHARPGRKDSEVIFDGRSLDWPWGVDDYGLEQAEANAQTLAAWIKAEIGESVRVAPYLVVPGWFVILKPGATSRSCRVANEKWLNGILTRAAPCLTAKQVELVALRLESRCRDVED